MTIFNPEHDLCIANGDANFVPPASALEFGKDCSGLVDWIVETSDDKIVPWGWDAVLKRRLERSGIAPEKLPPDQFVASVRALSGRGIAFRVNADVHRLVCSAHPSMLHILSEPDSVVELHDVEDVVRYVNLFGDAVMKSPLSGSGKGLRWGRAGELSQSDLGWCKNVITRQGSVMVEKRREVVQDFAMLFHVGESSVEFEGYSMFFSDNGIYKGNILASDEWILAELSRYVPAALILNIKAALTKTIAGTFVGKYSGFLGVDMFIFREAGTFRLAHCVEINVRMTMGLLARRLYDNHLERLVGPGDLDGRYQMCVEFSPRRGDLFARRDEAVASLTDVTPDSRYAVWVRSYEILS